MRQSMSKGVRHRFSSKQLAKGGAQRVGRGAKHLRGGRTPSRIAKARVVERIQRETQEVNGGSLLITLRRQGYEELPLEEIQDRLSKLTTALGEYIVSRRG